MPGVTKEQITRAKEWDLLSYLQTYEPQELRKCGAREYRTVTYGSLKISNGKWNWHSRGIGGRTALDYLVKVQGMDFVSAVETLCGERGADIRMPVSMPGRGNPRKPFLLPKENRCGTAPRALLQFLHDHPADTCVSLCLDNDKAGRLGMEKIREAVQADTELSKRIRVIADNPPPLFGGKDYNELLQKRAVARSAARNRERAEPACGMEK